MAEAGFFEKEVVAEYPKNQTMAMAIEGLDDTLLFTNFQGNVDLNYQVNYAFNNDAYMYVFGDKLSLSRITGIAFPKIDCQKQRFPVLYKHHFQ